MSKFGRRLTVLVSSVTLLSSLPFIGPAASVLAVGDVTINSATTFGDADASDGATDGWFTVTGDLTITSSGSITCNDSGASGASACAISIKVTGDMLMEDGSSIKAENTNNGGNGGAITIDVDGDMTLEGADEGPGAVISSRKTSGAGDTGVGGDIWITVGNPAVASGTFFMGGGSTTYGAETGARIDATGTGPSGDITILVGRNYFTEPGSVVASGGVGGTTNQQGGKITLVATCELTTQGRVTSKGQDPAGDLIHIEGCDVLIQGLVESTGKGHTVSNNENAISPPSNSCDGNDDRLVNEVIHTDKPRTATGCIEVWGKNVTIQSTGGWAGELNADVGNGGSAGSSWIDVYAFSTLVVADGTGNDRTSNNLGHEYFSTYAVHANQINGSDHTPGVVTAKVANGTLTANTVDGHTFQASTTGNGSDGGIVIAEALGNVNINDAFVNAAGDLDDSPNVNGGQIGIRSWAGNASWTSGDGDARPPDGSIALLACGTADALGTDFHDIVAVVTSGAPCGAPSIPGYVVFNQNGWALCQGEPPDLGSLIILKTDEQENPLAEAEFTVEGVDAVFTTDEDGIFCVDDLLLGATITVTETTAPAGFELADPDSQAVVVENSDDCDDRLEDGWEPDATFVNAPAEELGAVVVYKTDATTEDELVENAVFTIAPEVDIDNVFEGGDGSQTLDEVAPGIHCIDGLSFGDYVVTETTPPPNYEPADPDNQSVTVDSASSCDDKGILDEPDLTFENLPSEQLLAGIQVVKTDQNDDPLEGAEFKLYLDDGNDIFDPAGSGGGGGGGTQCVGDPNVNSADATAIANAIVADPSTLDGASFEEIPEAGTPNGTAGCLSWFATDGNTFGILTSGDVNLADDANGAPDDGANLGGGNVRGDSDLDVSVLKLDLTAPAGANCLRFDFAFYSEEYIEFVDTAFNDAFIAELNTSTWDTGTSTITAPDNFAFGPGPAVISINSTGATAMSLPNAAGTTYDGATALLSAATEITGPENSLYLSIFDQGDQIYDSAVFLDNIRFETVADPGTDCKEGATAGGDTLIGTQSTDGGGLALFTDLEAGTYWLQESAVPEGCELLEEVTKVILTEEQVTAGALVEVPLENDCSEQDVEGGNPTPTPGDVPDTAAGGAVILGWLPILMALALLGSLGALATVNVQSVRRRSRR